MDTLAVIAGGILLAAGVIFALFLGWMSERIEDEREHQAGTMP